MPHEHEALGAHAVQELRAGPGVQAVGAAVGVALAVCAMALPVTFLVLARAIANLLAAGAEHEGLLLPADLAAREALSREGADLGPFLERAPRGLVWEVRARPRRLRADVFCELHDAGFLEHLEGRGRGLRIDLAAQVHDHLGVLDGRRVVAREARDLGALHQVVRRPVVLPHGQERRHVAHELCRVGVRLVVLAEVTIHPRSVPKRRREIAVHSHRHHLDVPALVEAGRRHRLHLRVEALDDGREDADAALAVSRAGQRDRAVDLAPRGRIGGVGGYGIARPPPGRRPRHVRCQLLKRFGSDLGDELLQLLRRLDHGRSDGGRAREPVLAVRRATPDGLREALRLLLARLERLGVALLDVWAFQ
mmetsp:Transcript_13192/g.45126  ORF Transcript_13192/g.45126 Transcript_13192/m.45126 type:complete len:365 (+) Transcript_13192:281-1375(+)